MGKHAYLILAHKNWGQLKVLLSLLDNRRNDIFLHVDKKKYPPQNVIEEIAGIYDEMMKQGLLEEVKSMYLKRDLNSLNTVGYKELFNYLDGIWSLEEAVERMKGNTRRYCRKQLTWFKRDQSIHWFHPDEFDEIIHFCQFVLL